MKFPDAVKFMKVKAFFQKEVNTSDKVVTAINHKLIEK